MIGRYIPPPPVPPPLTEEQIERNRIASEGTLDELTALRQADLVIGMAQGQAALNAAQQRPAWKREADLIARGALAGFAVVRMADGSYVGARWGMVAALQDLDAVDAFLRRVGAPG